MGLRRMFLLLVICVAVILSEMGAAAVEFPIAKRPHCQDWCGDVKIPYPFGITEDCYLNQYFRINCSNDSSGHPQPVVGKNLVVTNISIDGELDILMYISHQCYESGKPVEPTNNPWINYPAFTISSTKNKFVTIGCDTYAYLNAFRNNERFSIGCMSICKSLINVENGFCTGIGCCQVDIPRGLKNFTLDARSYYNHTNVSDFNPCSFAFVAKEDDKFNFFSSYLESLRGNETYPMVLDWAIGIETCKTAPNKLDYLCGGNTLCDVPPEEVDGYRCKCKEGYKGNPYLPDGCQDINECEADPKPCNITTSRCNNIDGSFTCTCLDGYEGDGKIINESTSCRLKARANRSKINIIIPLAISIGLIGLFMGGSSIYFGLQRRKLIKLKEKFFQQNGGSLLQQKLSNYRASTEVAKIFSAEELEKATNNYDESRIIGQGGYGTVYRGVLPDNEVVAIKKSKICDQSQVAQFINEVIVLTQINHRNVVKMLGCCLETEVPLLVYQYITNGTLSSHIHDRNLSSSLSWKKRLKIASETAGALAYLHSSTSVPILHRDVKPANILLDDNYSAKVADFGTSILVPLDQTELSTLVKGTFGYLDPEYFYSNQLTEKSDVYSFGVVVAELLTGKKALCFDRPEKDRSLAMYFNSAVKESRLHQILDDQIVSDGNINVINEVANIAKCCLSVKGEDRPTMKEVAMELEGLIIKGKHPWVKSDLYREETEYLLGAPTHSFNIDVDNGSSSTITTVGFESTRNQAMKSLYDGR
ncbi:putative wall-associated receptor kinase-like 16 [Juglans microcarpa x Juglans regia]|uniref:putative wall-associated receptor kinase-like 16 n=1 Tax=Juglans microcarpa x Juglans regia TaxID=2249226 RepID=UPI001B7DD0EC|nr:putative wall-associated receptor kinase-like 16 [Juglans microcarpa x Juglans regia]